LNLETRIGIIVSTTKVHSIVAEDMALELMVTPLEVADCATMNGGFALNPEAESFQPAAVTLHSFELQQLSGGDGLKGIPETDTTIMVGGHAKVDGFVLSPEAAPFILAASIPHSLELQQFVGFGEQLCVDKGTFEGAPKSTSEADTTFAAGKKLYFLSALLSTEWKLYFYFI
jgi:hypothetical protein